MEQGELDSYLIEITANILAKKDKETKKPVIDIILDTAGQKGTGKWTASPRLTSESGDDNSGSRFSHAVSRQ
jgi:6-phosphogluconate dehydrogenase